MHQKTIYSFLLMLLIMSFCTQAANHCPESLAIVISVQGKVDLQNANQNNWKPLAKDTIFCFGDKIRTSKNSRATLKFKNDTRVSLDQNTTLTFAADDKKDSSWINDLINGSAFFRSREIQKINVQTPFINAVHEGTEYLVTVTANQAIISVFDGRVAASNTMGEVLIEKGYIGIAGKDAAPQIKALTIRPEDAVQWSLYYPAIIDYQKLDTTNTASLQSSINANLQNNPYKALTLMNAIPTSQQNADYLTLKSSLLLMFGSVKEAINLLDQALVLESDNSTAIALQSIISVTKNRQDKALSLAQQAVKHDPQSAIAQIALSYAYQSKFDIESALKATNESVRLSPKNALAWVRLSELQLSTGERNDALKSAQKAQELNPKLGRTQTILGFANLAQVEIDEAKSSFNQAINLDSSDPLAHLGLGLAKIRKGNIEEGTSDIETAVSLDPDNAIMRSYLGKAYYELKNDDFAATELAIAKEKDPKDPTPWFYDSIRKQTTNRPVEALHDMQKAIELNDNRGVYRSKLLLDEDAAARSANMARIYQDLGFDRVALKQAWTSLNQDYTNPSAHRFLSDTLQGRPRQRIARASELLQAQLLQPINIVPVQPQLTSENIGILNSTGTGSLSKGEYDALFTSNGAHILLNGAYGSNNTLTDSAIISGVFERLSLSLGQFHYQTDGFRSNDGYQQDIYNAFIQYAVTPNFNFQFEFKTEDIRTGDTPFRMNDFHKENFRQSIEQDTARAGARYRIDSEQDVLVSAFYTTRKDKTNDINQLQFGPFQFTTNSKGEVQGDGYQVEAQHLFHPKSLDITTGVGYLEIDQDIKINRNTTSSPPAPGFPQQTSIFNQSKTQYFNTYIYSKLQLLPSLTSILGLSFDSYQDNFINRQNLNPKVGLLWNPLTKLTLRSAAFRSLKRPLATNQTIEPTQIAGFNQFFDNANGTSAWQYAFGADYEPISTLFLGGEVKWRFVKEPFNDSGVPNGQERKESSHFTYLYWTPIEWLSFRAEYEFEKFKRDFTIGNGNQTDPRSVLTHQIPLSVYFFHNNGLFANLTGTYVKQKVSLVTDSVAAPLEYDKGRFWTFDSTLGFRLPKKFGLISFEVRNIFNNSFTYQSVFDPSGPQLSQFVPEREFFIKLNLFY